MGFYKQTYIGAFLTAKDVRKDVTETKKIQPSTGSEVHGSDLFDPLTGEKYLIKDVTENKVVRLNLWDVASRYSLDDDKLCWIEYGSMDGEVTLIPNSRNQAFSAMSDEYEFTFDISNIDIEPAKEAFREEFNDYITAIESDGHKVTVGYGVVHYVA